MHILISGLYIAFYTFISTYSLFSQIFPIQKTSLGLSIFNTRYFFFLCMCRPELCMCRPEFWSKYWIKKPKMWEKQFTLYFKDIFLKNFSTWSISSHQLWAGKLISGLYIAFPLFYIIFYIILRLLPCMLPPPSNQCMDPSDFVTTNFLWFFLRAILNCDLDIESKAKMGKFTLPPFLGNWTYSFKD